MVDFELHGPDDVCCSVNDEGYATLAVDSTLYTVGFGHSGYGSMIQVDGKLVTSEISGVIRGEKFFNRVDIK